MIEKKGKSTQGREGRRGAGISEEKMQEERKERKSGMK